MVAADTFLLALEPTRRTRPAELFDLRITEAPTQRKPSDG